MKTIVCIGTGPSLTKDQIESARSSCFTLYVCNNAYQIVPDAELIYGCNYEWWKYYWHDVRNHQGEKWTTNKQAAREFPINFISEKNAPGLSLDRDIIHHGHGSGYSLVSMAYRNGADRIVLLGYDMKYAHDYDGKARQIGSSPRHYFGEYDASMVHWPSHQVKYGVHVELLNLYKSIAEQGVVEVLNATPNSAIDCFERVNIDTL